MSPRGFSRQGHGRSPRRRTGWEQGPGSNTATSISADGVSFVGGGSVISTDGFTLVRLRGSVQAFILTATSAGDGFHCALGIGIVNSDAFSVGVTTVLDPLADMDWDGWLYHRIFDVHAQTTSPGGQDGEQISFEVDSKAMRKLTDGDVIFAALEVVEQGTATMNMFFDTRMLLKLP